MLSARLLRGSRHATNSLLLVDRLPEGLGDLAALEPVDNLKVEQRQYRMFMFLLSLEKEEELYGGLFL